MKANMEGMEGFKNVSGHIQLDHGSFRGHAVPGTLFMVWSMWWTVNIMSRYLVCMKAKRQFVSRPWFQWKFRPSPALEPLLLFVLCTWGILLELRLGHDSWRHITDAHGHLVGHSLNNWQHTAMYGAVAVYASVALLVHYVGVGKLLPAGTEQGFLALSFLVNGVLMGFHLKGPALEVRAHLMLVLIIAACCLLSLLELRYPESALLCTSRAAAVFFQGTWFYQIAHILYSGDPAWDLLEAAPVMFLPVVFVLHMMLIAVGYLLAFVAMYWWFMRYGSLGFLEGDHNNALPGNQQEMAVLIAKDYV